MLRKLWKDEAGTVAFEYLLVGTIVSLGLIVGLSAVTRALNTELTELGNAILGLSQGYSIATYSNCTAGKDGSNISDTAQTITTGQSFNTSSSANSGFCTP